MIQPIILLCCAAITILAGTAIAPGLPGIALAFLDQDPAGLRTPFLLTAPSLFVAICAPLAGYFSDRWRRIPVLLTGLGIFSMAGCAGLWISDLNFLLASRAVLGIGMGALVAVTSALISDYYQGQERARIMGWQGVANSGGGVLFLLLGGILAEQHWRAPFMTYGLGIVLLPLVWRFLPEPNRSAMAHTSAGNPTSDQPPSSTPLDLSSLAALLFSALVGMAMFYLIPVLLPFVLQNMGVRGTWVGAVLALSTLCSALTASRYAWLRLRLSDSLIAVILFSLMALALVLLSQAQQVHHVWPALILNGIGLGLFFPSLSFRVAALAPIHLRGRIMGALGSSFFVGQFLSPLFSAALISQGLNQQQVFLAAGACLVFLALSQIRCGATPKAP